MLHAILRSYEARQLYEVYRWGDGGIIAVGALCFAALGFFAVHRSLSFCRYMLLSTLPLFFSLTLSVVLSAHTLWPEFSGEPFAWIGGPIEQFAWYALLYSGIGLSCTAFLCIVFGAVLVAGRRTKA
jgi:hypothetical protein